MKKILSIIILCLALTTCVNAQTYYHLNKNKPVSATNTESMAKASGSDVKISFVPITFSQLDFKTSFFQIAFEDGKVVPNAGVLSFTPSYVLGSANSIMTITNNNDTIYKLSQVLAYGAGITLSENITTGKVGLAPSLIGQVGNYAALGGYDFINKQFVAGISFAINDIPFVNRMTTIKHVNF